MQLLLLQLSRALKYHGGAKLSNIQNEDLDALEKGFDNLDKHIENMQLFGFNPIVAVNKFDSDTQE